MSQKPPKRASRARVAHRLRPNPRPRGAFPTAALGSLLGRTHPLLAQAAERPFTKLPALANASLTLLDWPGPELVAFNETAHLA